MRLRLFHQLFILITATVLVAVLSMAAVMALNLQRGFAGYLEARDTEELEQFVAVASQRIAAGGGAPALRDGRITLGSLLGDLAKSQGRPPRPRPPPPPGMGPPPGYGPPDFGPPPEMDGRRPPPPPPRGPHGRRPRPPEDFGARLILFDASRTLIAGPPGAATFPPERGTTRPIQIDGRTVALVQLIPRGRTPRGVEARFLTSQYRGAMWLAVLLIALGALAAWGLARLGAKRLARVKDATDAIAGGDFSYRLPDHGHDEIDEVARNVNRMADSLARLDTARRRWLAEVSHELRTPLSAIRGELDALEDGVRVLDAAAVVSLNEEARRLSGLIEDLHFLAMSDLSGQPCHFAPADAVALCCRAVVRFGSQAQAAGIELTFENAVDDDRAVLWDAGRIEQLLANLLSNSLRYTDAPGKVRLSLASADGRLQLTVEDSAPGVPPEHLDQLFVPLYRLDAARSRVTGGSGLGLAVSEAIVRAHGGTIAAEASSLGGLAIRIDLPREAAT